MAVDHILRGRSAAYFAAEPRTDDFLQLALTYREWGWRTFPLRTKDKPAVYWRGLATARYSDWLVGSMFGRPAPKRRRRTPRCQLKNIRGLAVIPGWCSGGLAVRDFDRRDTAKEWIDTHPEVARQCPIARTARGYHIYFRLPRGCKSIYVAGDDGELIADGRHYVVLPPSYHSAGNRYRWAHHEPHSPSDIPILDPYEHDLIPQPKAPKAKTKPFASTKSNTNTSCVAQTNTRTFNQFANAEEAIDHIIDECLPSGIGERNACLWQLARHLRSLPQYADATSPESDDIYQIVERWYDSAVPAIRTKSMKICWDDFRRQFATVKVPLGQGLQFAIEKAERISVPDHIAEQYAGPDLRLAKLCYALQSCAGRGAFFLSCRSAKDACGYGSHHTAARRLKAFCERGILELDRCFHHTQRKATCYRVVAVSVPIETVTADDRGLVWNQSMAAALAN